MNKYVIDSCSLINAAKNYNLNKKSFRNIWLAIDELIDNGLLYSTVEVLDEIKDDDLIRWCNSHKHIFLPLSKGIQEKTAEVLKECPHIIKIKSVGNSNADPFLIATAIMEDAIIVTDEKMGDEKSLDYRIPNVCKKFGIGCISLNAFLDQILE